MIVDQESDNKLKYRHTEKLCHLVPSICKLSKLKYRHVSVNIHIFGTRCLSCTKSIVYYMFSIWLGIDTVAYVFYASLSLGASKF